MNYQQQKEVKVALAQQEFEVFLERIPEETDWYRCKKLALCTAHKNIVNAPDDNWKKAMLKCKHSPIRTLMFTIKMTIPYYVSTHFVRHKFGVEHYVTSQRNDRQSRYDRTTAPQGAMVWHTMDINAEALINMSHRRLCGNADEYTRRVMQHIVELVEEACPEFKGEFVPNCQYLKKCPEMYPCKERRGE